MAYKKGELHVGGIPCNNDDCYFCSDSINGAYLPHSCDEWEIGQEQEIKWLIEDLQKALKDLEI